MAAPPLMVPGSIVLSRYRLGRRLGEGGMGTVFEVEDLDLRRVCALKVLRARWLGDVTAYERFMREAEFAAGLEDAHVVRVFERGELEKGVPYYTMELLRGRSLGATAELEHRLPWGRARHITIQLCRVLALVHARKIVHRDLKPDNCFLVVMDGDKDFLKLLDFGLARDDADGGDPRLTATSQVIGTALYMSPQQARGEKVDHRVDVYAVGVILYQLLAGYPPFERPNALQVLEAIKNETPAPPSSFNPTLPPEVDALVGKAMHKDLALRHQSAEALLAAIEAIPADAAGTIDAVALPRTPPPRVHTPSALAMTQAAGEANAPVVGPLATRTEIAPAPRALPRTESLSHGRIPWMSGRGRRLAVGGAGVLMTAVVVTALMIDRAPLPSTGAPTAATTGVAPVPRVEPAKVEPAAVEPVKAAVVEPATDDDRPDPAVPEGLTPVVPAAQESTPKQPKSSVAFTEKEAKFQVEQWHKATQKHPLPACNNFKYAQSVNFTVKGGREGLEINGEGSSITKSCVLALKSSFRLRFARKSVRAPVAVPLAFTFKR